MNIRSGAWLATLLLAVGNAHAVTVYRCADATYTDKPCKGAQVLDIDPGVNAVEAERRVSTYVPPVARGPYVAGLRNVSAIPEAYPLGRRRWYGGPYFGPMFHRPGPPPFPGPHMR